MSTLNEMKAYLVDRALAEFPGEYTRDGLLAQLERDFTAGQIREEYEVAKFIDAQGNRFLKPEREK